MPEQTCLKLVISFPRSAFISPEALSSCRLKRQNSTETSSTLVWRTLEGAQIGPPSSCLHLHVFSRRRLIKASFERKKLQFKLALLPRSSASHFNLRSTFASSNSISISTSSSFSVSISLPRVEFSKWTLGGKSLFQDNVAVVVVVVVLFEAAVADLEEGKVGPRANSARILARCEPNLIQIWNKKCSHVAVHVLFFFFLLPFALDRKQMNGHCHCFVC